MQPIEHAWALLKAPGAEEAKDSARVGQADKPGEIFGLPIEHWKQWMAEQEAEDIQE